MLEAALAASFISPMHYHLIGICGTAMASLAGMLQARGFKVTGSDQNVYPPMSTQLEALGIAILNGYRAENADIGADVTGTLFPVFRLSPTTLALQVAASLAIGVVAAAWPAWRTSRINIVSGLRHVG